MKQNNIDTDDNEIVYLKTLQDSLMEGNFDEGKSIFESLTNSSNEFLSNFNKFIVSRSEESPLTKLPN